MADKPLIYYSFALFRKTDNDAQTANPDPFGWFYARANTVRFFDIAKFAQDAYKKTRKGYTRVNTLADGTNLNGGGTINVKEHLVTFSAKSSPTGGRNARLVTGKPTKTVTAGQKATFHTVSFNFPHWATNSVISDALATILPDANVKDNPGANDVWPFFIVGSGRKFPIMTKAAATADTESETPISDAQFEQLLSSQEGAPKPVKKQKD